MVLQQQSQPLFLLDTLYCEEDDGVEDLQELMSSSTSSNNGGIDLFRDDDGLLSMFSKETKIDLDVDGYFPPMARREAVEWMLKVNAFHGFTSLTVVLAVNYLDRFLTSFRFQRDDGNKPWMIHLVAVACLSLAAKVEEAHVPLLLDLHVGEIRYVFESKTIQRMELLILSTLKWKMHPITPLSFLNHIIRRLGLKIHLHWELLKKCEQLLFCVISDSRSMHYLPSVLATATMMYVIDQIEPFTLVYYRDQLLNVLQTKKAGILILLETVNECYKLVVEVSKRPQNNNNASCPKRRKLIETDPSSPDRVIDACGSSPSVPSSPEPPFKKLSRAQEQDMQ
ncbi:Cyclin-D3-1 [Hibiscus syriacus]|uniref:Cyclin-D3-1 n=1 Tax=Hibiscus syriacus TaxID=106335 RepID=A0A6A3B433_HIBSY|nr:Cyclin-D3-1 [Hibiscus syriacus]